MMFFIRIAISYLKWIIPVQPSLKKKCALHAFVRLTKGATEKDFPLCRSTRQSGIGGFQFLVRLSLSCQSGNLFVDKTVFNCKFVNKPDDFRFSSLHPDFFQFFCPALAPAH